MTLNFQSQYKSIRGINSIDLPNFTLLVGKNGSGKSHFLQAIKGGQLHFNSLGANEIGLFSFEDFLIKNQKKISKGAVDALKKGIWDNLQQVKPTFLNIDNQIKNIYDGKYPYEQNINNDAYKRLIQQLKTTIEGRSSNNQQYKALGLSGVFSSGKFFTDLTDEDFYKSASFDEFDYSLMANLSEIFINYAIELAIQKNKNQIGEIANDEFAQYQDGSPWSFVDKIFLEFGLPHKITYPEINIEKIARMGQNLEFQAQLVIGDETIDFQDLSSGERILCALAITIFQNSKDHFPKIILLDEIDAFLHPSMIKNLINVIHNVFLEKGCKVILTSHSPTTVALVEEESIYEMQPGVVEEKIKKISQFDAIDLLSEGFATFSGEKLMFENIINSTKSLILYVEGPTDIIHINKAKEKLGITLDYDIFHCRDAGRLGNFLKSVPQGLFQDKKIIGIFDFDNEGKKSVKIGSEVENEKHYIHSEDSNIHAITLPVLNEDLIKVGYCPIEFLYSKEDLDKIDGLLVKRHLSKINSLPTFRDTQIGQNEFESIDQLWVFKVSDECGKKMEFSNLLDTFDYTAFEHFRPLFDKINTIQS